MRKEWRVERWVIIACVVLVLCAVIPRLAEYQKDDTEFYHVYHGHLMVDDVIYWRSRDALPYVAELPTGFEPFSEVETTTEGLSEENGQANGFAVGATLCRSENHPGVIYAEDQNGRWSCMTVKELQQDLLRYNGRLYISTQSSIPAQELNISYRFIEKEYAPTGESVSFSTADCVPMENRTVNYRPYDGLSIYLNPEQEDMVALADEGVHNGKKSSHYYPFITVESLGLDYSVYEWKYGARCIPIK